MIPSASSSTCPRVFLNLSRTCSSDVGIKMLTMSTLQSIAVATSCSRARANPQMRASRPRFATAFTHSFSWGDTAGNPASITSMPMVSSIRAIPTFSSQENETPGVCSPSLSVTSQISIFHGFMAASFRTCPFNNQCPRPVRDHELLFQRQFIICTADNRTCKGKVPDRIIHRLHSGHSRAVVLHYNSQERKLLFIDINQCIQPRMEQGIIPYERDMGTSCGNSNACTHPITCQTQFIGLCHGKDRTARIADHAQVPLLHDIHHQFERTSPAECAVISPFFHRLRSFPGDRWLESTVIADKRPAVLLYFEDTSCLIRQGMNSNDPAFPRCGSGSGWFSCPGIQWGCVNPGKHFPV